MVGPEFASCLLKLCRAEEHFNILSAEMILWKNSEPYIIAKKSDAEGSRYGFIVEIKKPPPVDRWSLIAGDCIHNLRSALDTLIYALAIRDSGSNPPPRENLLQFPITDSLRQFKESLWRIRPLRPKRRHELSERSRTIDGIHNSHPFSVSSMNSTILTSTGFST